MCMICPDDLRQCHVAAQQCHRSAANFTTQTPLLSSRWCLSLSKCPKRTEQCVMMLTVKDSQSASEHHLITCVVAAVQLLSQSMPWADSDPIAIMQCKLLHSHGHSVRTDLLLACINNPREASQAPENTH